MQRDTSRGWTPALIGIGGLLILLGGSLWLRWQYAQNVALHVDEFTTLWATRRILENGVPIMPSGVIYTRGILATYVTAAFAAVGGLTYLVGRLPSVLFGLAAIVAVALIGRREWNARVGWLAAVGLALLPEAIIWSGRARFYAQLLFFVLLTIWSAYAAIQPRPREGTDEPPRPAWIPHLTFAAMFTLALFSQEETILLYPPLFVAMLWWRGWRYLRHPAALTAQLLCILAMAARYALEIIGQPGYFETMQTSKPYLGIFFDLADAWGSYQGLFVSTRRLPWTILALLALAVALHQLWRARGRVGVLTRYHQATIFFALPFAFVLLVLLTAVGRSWRETRYLLMVQPCWLLMGAAGAVWLLDRATGHRTWRWVGTGVLTVLLVALMWAPAVSTLEQEAEGFQPAFAYVARHLRPGDVVITSQPPACALVLGRPCDYYVAERSYESYVIQRGDRLVDRWSGAQLLNTADQLQALLQSGARVWFVTDGERLARRFYIDYILTTVEQFDLAFEESGVRVLLADGWQEPPAYAVERTYEPPLDAGELALAELRHSAPVPGQSLAALLFWRQDHFIGEQINTSLQLVAADGARVTQADGPPARGMIGTADWAPLVPDMKALLLPDDLAAGRYRLEVITYDAATQTPATLPQPVAWFHLGPGPAAPDRPLGASWQDGVELVGHDELAAGLTPGEALDVRLVWQAAAPVSADYTVFLHLIGPDGALIAQSDRQPEGGFYPTSHWEIGDPVADVHQLALPAEIAPGDYRLVVGLYRPDTGARLLGADGADALELQRWSVAE